MCKIIEIFLTLFVSVVFCNVVELPEYIKTCSVHDPDINECFKRHANLAFETLKYGDSQFDSPKFDTFHMFDNLKLKPVPALPFTLTITDCHQFGLDNIRVQNAKVDLVNKHIEILFYNELIIWRCQYEAQTSTVLGGISASSGSHNITFTNGQYLQKMDYNLKDVNGEQYIDITSHSLDFLNVNIAHQLEHIGAGQNSLLNRLWEQAEPHFASHSVKQECSIVVTNIINKFFKVVPYKKLFIP